jgi:hypothetical protein
MPDTGTWLRTVRVTPVRFLGDHCLPDHVRPVRGVEHLRQRDGLDDVAFNGINIDFALLFSH